MIGSIQFCGMGIDPHAITPDTIVSIERERRLECEDLVVSYI
jgi:hypothetical protein